EKKYKSSQKYTIKANREVVADHFELVVDAPWLAREVEPGQFVQVRANRSGTDPLLRIPLGVHKAEKDRVALLYRVVGNGTATLSERRPGEKIDILGPLGNGFDLDGFNDNKDRKAVLVAGGHGMAPLYLLARRLKEKGVEVEILQGVCEAKYILCREEINKLGIEMTIATECGREGYKGYVTDLLEKSRERFIGEQAQHLIYGCGPRPMLKKLAALARENGFSASLSLDAYMACGIGVCLGCAVETVSGYKYVCKEGPVFDSRQILWDKISMKGCRCENNG
ncbi:MAG: hypothetical protein GF392_02535, partial [Candidatus Omnitrophica bacterium]|nr:hypothetical protein [Candidatus Omnitrophota bacterium]